MVCPLNVFRLKFFEFFIFPSALHAQSISFTIYTVNSAVYEALHYVLYKVLHLTVTCLLLGANIVLTLVTDIKLHIHGLCSECRRYELCLTTIQKGNEKQSYSNLFLSVDVTEGQGDRLKVLLRHTCPNYLQMSHCLAE